MPLESKHPRTAAYFGRAAALRGHSGSDRADMVCQMLTLLERWESEDQGLQQRIEDKLDKPPEFGGSDEQRRLRMVVDSVLGDGHRVRRSRTKTEPLGDAD